MDSGLTVEGFVVDLGCDVFEDGLVNTIYEILEKIKKNG